VGVTNEARALITIVESISGAVYVEGPYWRRSYVALPSGHGRIQSVLRIDPTFQLARLAHVHETYHRTGMFLMFVIHASYGGGRKWAYSINCLGLQR